MRDQRRLVGRADLGRVAAARVEAAAARRVDRARHVALEHDPLALRRSRIGDRHRREQRLGVRVDRPLVELLGRRELDDLAEVHHRDAVGDVAHDAEVVRDEDVGQRELVLQVVEQVHDLRLDRDVERRDGLVGDDQPRVAARARARRRCAAAGRPRTRAGSGCSARARARRRPSAPARAAWRRRATVPWMTSGSAMIAPTRLRGLSEAYGSWKTICISRRSGRSARRVEPRDVAPVEHARCPTVSSCRRTRQRPSVDLPQPDSPTRPSVSPARTSKRDAVDGLHARRPRAAGRRVPLTGKCFVDLARLEQHLAAHADELRVDRRLAPRELLGDRQVAAVEVARAPRAPRARGGSLAARREARAGSAARTRSPAAARAATAAGPGSSSGGAAAAGRCAGSSRAAPTCTGAAAFANSSRFGPSSTMRPAYITHDAVGDVGDDAHVVRDQHDRRAEVACAACGSAPGSAPGS